MSETLLRVADLRVSFDGRDGSVDVLDGVGFEVGRGEIVGLVGETGSGKTMSGLSVLRLVPPPGRIVDGEIEFDGIDLLSLPAARMRALRGARISMIFQDPNASLNPVFSLGAQLDAVLATHTDLGRRDRRARALAGLRAAHLPDSERLLAAYPHQLSGGMQQRAMIALALAAEPDLLIADEPTTALDVTIQAQILELLRELRETRGLSILLIAHNLAVVGEICDRVVVFYAGRVAEAGPARAVLSDPKHPYTRGLVASLPRSGGAGTPIAAMRGSMPAPGEVPPGCAFAPRCPHGEPRFLLERPPLVRTGDRAVACWLYTDGRVG